MWHFWGSFGITYCIPVFTRMVMMHYNCYINARLQAPYVRVFINIIFALVSWWDFPGIEYFHTFSPSRGIKVDMWPFCCYSPLPVDQLKTKPESWWRSLKAFGRSSEVQFIKDGVTPERLSPGQAFVALVLCCLLIVSHSLLILCLVHSFAFGQVSIRYIWHCLFTFNWASPDSSVVHLHNLAICDGFDSQVELPS